MAGWDVQESARASGSFAAMRQPAGPRSDAAKRHDSRQKKRRTAHRVLR